MNLSRIKELKQQIAILEDELKLEQTAVLEYFRNMSEEDSALCENKISNDGVLVQYFPKSTSKTVDTAKLKKDGIYENYVKEVSKSDYIKVSLGKEV